MWWKVVLIWCLKAPGRRCTPDFCVFLMGIVTRGDSVKMHRVVLNLLFGVVSSFRYVQFIWTAPTIEGFSEKADAWSPVALGRSLGIDGDVVRERICVGCRDWGDVIFVAINDVDDLVRSFLE